MVPSLSILSGPLAGTQLPLKEGELTVGRHSSNDLQLAELAVSRHHCVLTTAAGELSIRDLESLHGTFVNGIPVQEARLEDGDLVVLGESSFSVNLLPEPVPGRSSSPQLASPVVDTALNHDSTVALSMDEARLFPRASTAAAPETDKETAAALAALLGLSRNLQEVSGIQALGDTLVESLLDMIPADRASLFLESLFLDDAVGDAYELQSSRLAAQAAETHSEAASVSQTVLARVTGERVALLATEVAANQDLAQAESIQASGLRSLLCIPLLEQDRVFGVLYLEAWSVVRRLTEHHLELATAAARIAALALLVARRQDRLEAENRRLEDAALGHGLVGQSEAMKKVSTLLRRVALTDSTLLLRGESGTGKELAAVAVHRASARARKPFVAINCASLSEQLLESELFGHERGAFTSAVQRKLGKLEVADGGTVFLDELGELPAAQQAKLLRVLESRTFERVGSNHPIRVDIRLIAATNRDLEEAVRAGRFREDLFYRLNVISVEMPPLRERREDIGLLARHFAKRTGERIGRRVSGVSQEAIRLLQSYPWPGNVRELANAIERALVLGNSDVIEAGDLPESVHERAAPTAGPEEPASYHEALNREKGRIILAAVETAGGNITQAAERLRLHPNHLHRLISNLGLRDRIR